MKDVAHADVLPIQLAGLTLEVLGRRSLNSPKNDEDDWLSMSARCRASGAEVLVSGLIVSIPAIERWRDQMMQIQQSFLGTTTFGDLEQHLLVELMALSLGHIWLKVGITPDHMTQQHSFQFEIDQTYLSPLLVQCGALLDQYPLRSKLPVVR